LAVPAPDVVSIVGQRRLAEWTFRSKSLISPSKNSPISQEQLEVLYHYIAHIGQRSRSRALLLGL
jgi:hypothetical protein